MSINNPEEIKTDDLKWPHSKDDTVTPDLKHQDDLTNRFEGVVESLSTGTDATPPNGIDNNTETGSGDHDRNPSRVRMIVVGGVALTATVIVAALGYNQIKGSDSTEPRVEPSASAPANPVETRAVGPVDPIELVGKPEADSIDNLNVKPSQEVIDQALKGVSASEFETPQEAFVQLTNIYNVAELSATVDNSTQPEDTPESLQLREQLRSKLFTKSSLENGQFAQENLVRANLGSLLEAVNEYEITADGPLTWHSDFSVKSIDQTSENKFSVEATKTLYSNFGTTDGLDFSNMIKNVDVSKQGQSVSIDMVKNDGYWYFDSYETK